MFQTVGLIFVGGGIGSLARFGVSAATKQFFNGSFPLSTLISNILSCIIMGVALGMFSSKLENDNVRMFVVVGICGGFSTFSTFSMETVDLFRNGQMGYAIANVMFSLVLCMTTLYFLVRK